MDEGRKASIAKGSRRYATGQEIRVADFGYWPAIGAKSYVLAGGHHAKLFWQNGMIGLLQANFGAEWAGRSSMSLYSTCVLASAIILALVGRQSLVFAIILVVMLIPSSERIVVFGLDLGPDRLILGWGFLLNLANVRRLGKLNRLDIIVIAFATIQLWPVLAGRSVSLVNRLGASFDVVVPYLVFRCLIRSTRDVDVVCLGFAVAALFLFPVYLQESLTGQASYRNYAGISGELVERSGGYRCQGPFLHAISSGLAFSIGATLVLGNWIRPVTVTPDTLASRRRPSLVVGLLAILLVCFPVLVSRSTGPWIVALIGFSICALYNSRRYVPGFCMAAGSALLLLHFLLGRGVFGIPAKLGIIGGGSGDHRSRLLEAAWSNLSQWWIAGTAEVGSWGYYMDDVANQYLAHGVTTGIVGLVLWIAVLGSAIKRLYRLSSARAIPHADRVACWSVFSALVAVSAGMFGVTLFSGVHVFVMLLLAFAGSLRQEMVMPSVRSAP